MGNLKNAALFWCKIKGYIMFFLAVVFGVFLVKNLETMSVAETSKDRDNARRGAVICAIFIGIFTLIYFILKTDVGCGLSIVNNAYHLVR